MTARMVNGGHQTGRRWARPKGCDMCGRLECELQAPLEVLRIHDQAWDACTWCAARETGRTVDVSRRRRRWWQR